MRANYVATALCVLCVFGSAMASQQKMFAELMHEAKAGVASRPSGADGHVDYKHLCLREAKHYNCRTLGCQDIDRCGAGDTGCYDCVTGLIFQSDMSCCGSPHDHDDKNYYSAANSVAAGGTGFHSPYLKVGTCDWDITVDSRFQCWASEEECGVLNITEANSMMRRIGTAFATCYLTSGAEYCDDMLCDKMVMRFQGGFYLSGARSYQEKSLYDASIDETGRDDLWCGPPIPTDGLPVRHNAGSSNTTREVYTGVALLASGTVSLTSLRKEVEYPVGHMDYVYDFYSIADAFIGDIQTRFGLAAGDYPFVTPNTYKLKLVGEKKATYKK